tara:strand:+ start:1123 stop:2631 length:1509 start_codon:yes stop_codon:yes gene_type:complete
MSRVSTVAAKNVQLRAEDFSSSSSSVYLKAYDASSTYDLYFPDKNPKFLDGVSGSLQVANQTLTYDVTSDKYIWAQAQSSELFLQGQTDTIGSDEMGNVMTIKSEERVVAGDPMYDPTLPDNQQKFKATYKFTDELFNMKELTSGKKTISSSFAHDISSITYSATTATATLASGHSIVNGTTVTISGATDDTTFNGSFTASNVQATSFEYTLLSTPASDATNSGIEVSYSISSGVDHSKTTGLYFQYADVANYQNALAKYLLENPSSDEATFIASSENPAGLNVAAPVAPSGSTDVTKQLFDSIVLQTKKTVAGSNHAKVTINPLDTQLATVDETSATKSTLKLTQATQEISFSDAAKFSVDNALKSVSMDMNTIVFGPSDKKHRLFVNGEKLLIQKYDSTSSSWVGADVVIDAELTFTATISITATNTVAGKIDITAVLTGTYDHFHVKLDDGSESMAATGATTEQIDSTYIGKHRVIAYAADATHKRISEYAVFDIITTM